MALFTAIPDAAIMDPDGRLQDTACGGRLRRKATVPSQQSGRDRSRRDESSGRICQEFLNVRIT
jgi:hypothetical protein